MMKPIAIIPARFASTRFPGKPLAMIHGKPMIQHVYERCKEVFNWVVVATDDERIVKALEKFGGEVVFTSPNHTSGTDRCAEAAKLLSSKYDFDIIVNVQGDEPFIETEQLKLIQSCFNDDKTEIATLITPINSSDILFDSNKVKATCTINNFALFFSRHPIPFQRDIDKSKWLENHDYFLHLGLYAYKIDTLNEITKLEQSSLEKSEKLEQLRWLENGFSIKTAITPKANFGIDTPEDLKNILKI